MRQDGGIFLIIAFKEPRFCPFFPACLGPYMDHQCSTKLLGQDRMNRTLVETGAYLCGTVYALRPLVLHKCPVHSVLIPFNHLAIDVC